MLTAMLVDWSSTAASFWRIFSSKCSGSLSNLEHVRVFWNWVCMPDILPLLSRILHVWKVFCLQAMWLHLAHPSDVNMVWSVSCESCSPPVAERSRQALSQKWRVGHPKAFKPQMKGVMDYTLHHIWHIFCLSKLSLYPSKRWETGGWLRAWVEDGRHASSERPQPYRLVDVQSTNMRWQLSFCMDYSL